MAKYYTYIQNNSGGYYVGPVVVVVRANTAAEANQKAMEHELYFDGNGDCPCCGRRWDNALEDDGCEEPYIYDCKIKVPDLEAKYDSFIEHVDHDGDAYIFGYKGEKFLYLP